MVLDRLEALPVGRFHYKLLGVTGLGWLFDSMDTGLIAFILPVLAKEWQLAPGQMGLIGSIGLIGMALGAVVSGTVADHIGRKKVFTITVLLYSIATAFCAMAWDYTSLLIFRFLVGFGLGGELPVAATLVSEYAPAHVRGKFIVLLESFWALGWIVAACIAYFFIPVYGWRMAFWLGAVPAVYVFLIRLHMPESVRFLLSKGRIQEARQIIVDLEERLHVPVNLLAMKKKYCQNRNRCLSRRSGKSLSCHGRLCFGSSGLALTIVITVSLCGCRLLFSSKALQS